MQVFGLFLPWEQTMLSNRYILQLKSQQFSASLGLPADDALDRRALSPLYNNILWIESLSKGRAWRDRNSFGSFATRYQESPNNTGFRKQTIIIQQCILISGRFNFAPGQVAPSSGTSWYIVFYRYNPKYTPNVMITSNSHFGMFLDLDAKRWRNPTWLMNRTSSIEWLILPKL